MAMDCPIDPVLATLIVGMRPKLLSKFALRSEEQDSSEGKNLQLGMWFQINQSKSG